MEPNYGKESFGAWMNSYGQTPVTDTCHNYGSMSGYDERCPALLMGDCRNITDAIECRDLPEEEIAEILSLYFPQKQGTQR